MSSIIWVRIRRRVLRQHLLIADCPGRFAVLLPIGRAGNDLKPQLSSYLPCQRVRAASLYPKAWLDYDGPASEENLWLLTEQGLSFDLAEDDEYGPGFLQRVRANLPQYYGQNVTRQIFDLTDSIVRWTRLANSDYFE